jgi:hypothetical protein
MDSEQQLTAEQAAAIWKRAAQLQAEAAHRLEERSRALVENSVSRDDHESLRLADVRSVAAEVGIAAEFVALAINELEADPIGALPPEQDEKATRFLGTASRSLELSRIIDCPVGDVYTTLQRVLPAYPWLLSLRDVTGDPLQGGPMIFAVPSMWTTGMQVTPLAYHGYAVDVNQIQVILRRVPAEKGEACEIVLRAGLHRSVRRNFRFGRWSAGLSSVIGGGVGGAIGAGAIGLAGAMLVLPVAAGAVLSGAGVAVGYRAMYRHYLRKFTELLNEMLATVTAQARTGGAFASVTPPAPSALSIRLTQ